MKAIHNFRDRTRTWAVFVCLTAAVLALHGCAGSTTADGSEPTGGGKTGGKGKAGGRRSFDGGGPAPVVVAKVTQKDVPIEVAVVGNVEAYATITIIPQVGGQLQEVAFSEGDLVKKGQKLFVIDPDVNTSLLQTLIDGDDSVSVCPGIT